MSGLLPGGSVNQSAPAAASLNIQTSSYATPMQLVYGTTLTVGNLMWFGDFKAIGNTQSAGGKGGGGSVSSTTYTYQVAAMIGISDGGFNAGASVEIDPVTGAVVAYQNIRKIYVNQQILNLADLSMGTFQGAIGQAPWSYLTSNHPTQAIGYSGIGYVASSAYQLGSTPSMPQHNFEVLAPYGNLGMGVYDATPFAVAADLLTNANHGVGFPGSALVDLSGNYQYVAGIWVSPAYRSQSACSDLIKKLAMIANCDLVWSSGQLRWSPYGLDAIYGGPGVTQINGSPPLAPQTWTPTYATPVYAFTDDDFVDQGSADPVTVIRKDALDAYNSLQLTYRDRTNAYADAIAEAKDQDQIEKYGLRIMPPVDAREICDGQVARTVAQLILQKQIYIRSTYKFRVSYRYILLDPMDLVTLTESTGSGLQGQVVRVTQVQENADGTIDVEAEDVIGNVTTAAVYPHQVPSGYNTNYNAAPGSINPPVIFDAPGRLTATDFEIWCAVAGSNPALWGGCQVWVSLDGNTYKQAGQINAPARYGVLSAALPAGSDPDTSDVISVDLSASAGGAAHGFGRRRGRQQYVVMDRRRTDQLQHSNADRAKQVSTQVLHSARRVQYRERAARCRRALRPARCQHLQVRLQLGVARPKDFFQIPVVQHLGRGC